MAAPPPPKRLRRRSLLDLVDDLIPEILLRLPPHDPERFFRCSAVCAPWRRLLTDPAFLRRYYAFHGGAPLMLGFLFNVSLHDDLDHPVAQFDPTTSFRPRTDDLGDWYAHESRHGRVLFHTVTYEEGGPDLVVWNPITDQRWGLRMPPVPFTDWNVAVLCAKRGGCDHIGCHGGPFLVAFVGTSDEGVTSACVYSSEAAAWGDAASAEHPADLAEMDMKPSVLVGNKIYFLAVDSRTIVEYDLDRRQLSFIDPPFAYTGQGVLMPAVDGGLGFAGVMGTSLYLWSRKAGPDGTAAWAQRRVIQLNTLPTSADLYYPTAVGFAEGLDAIFVGTNAGVFEIELKSGGAKKVSSWGSIDVIIPYISFYTPDHAMG